jgi:hypothetical protein
MKIRCFVGTVAVWIAIPIGYTSAQDQDERQITLVGCVMRETDYRDMYGPGLSGPRGAGIGGRNEYMLVDANETTPGTSITAEAAGCPPAPGTFPTAYELTGSREGDVAAFLGRRVELTGIQKEANARPVGTSGIPRPTGGFDPLGHELHLFEVEVGSVRETAIARTEAPAAAAPAERAEVPVPAAEPAPAAEVPAPEAEVAAPVAAPAAEVEREVAAAPPEPQAEVEKAPQVAQRQLPPTASPLPLAGLLGLLSLAAAAGVRSLHRR